MAAILAIIRGTRCHPVALANEPVMGADFDKKICSQISPVDPSLVDKNALRKVSGL